MRIIMRGGETLALPGCLARFGAGFCILTAQEITHQIKRWRLYRVTGPPGIHREHVGIVDFIEV